MALDENDNLYVADDGNLRIRKIDRQGNVTTFGPVPELNSSPRAPRAAIRESVPIMYVPMVYQRALAVSNDGTVFIALGACIWRVLPNGLTTILAGSETAVGHRDGYGADARFLGIRNLRILANGDLLVTDTGSEAIRRVTMSGVVSTVAGRAWFRIELLQGVPEPNPYPLAVDGGAGTARFLNLFDSALAPDGTVYALDWATSGAVRRVVSDGGIVTIAGTVQRTQPTWADGQGSSARFAFPQGMVFESPGAMLVTELGNRRIRRVTTDGAVTTVAGDGSVGTANGLGTQTTFFSPTAIVIDRQGDLFVSDTYSQTIRKGVRVRRPVITAQPQARTGNPGEPVTLTVTSSSVVPVTYQWYKDGAPVAGATSGTLQLPAPGPASSGSYTVVITNAVGSVQSAPAIIAAPLAPTVAVPPQAQALLGGEPIVLTVTAAGAGPFTYQWHKDGAAIAGATSPTLRIEPARAADAGSYHVVITSPSGSVASTPALVTVNTGRIVNLSIRAAITASSPLLTVGFVISGPGKPLLARAIGPALRAFGIDAPQPDPRMTIFAGGAPVDANDNWSTAANAAQIAATSAQAGAFPLPAGGGDAAVLSTFNPGAYSLQASGRPNEPGLVLVELYDASPDTAARLVNVSTRALAGTGEDALVAGFVIAGNTPRQVLVRAVGPTLEQFGVTGVLRDPRLEIISARGTTVAGNDDWEASAPLLAAVRSRGAFPLLIGSGDSALLVTLEPGGYSAKVTGAGGTSGEVLLEIYEVP